MKKLLPLITLAALVSCNGGNSKSKVSKIVADNNANLEKSVQEIKDNADKAIAALPKVLTKREIAEKAMAKLLANSYVGMVTETLELGKENNIRYIEGVGQFTVDKVQRSSKRTLLKIDGSVTYSLIEEEGAPKSIYIQDMADISGLLEQLEAGKASVVGETLFSQDNSELLIGSNYFSLEVKATESTIQSLEKPCISNVTVTDTEVIGMENNVQKMLPKQERILTSSCGNKLSVEALKALDLKSIEVCDGRNDGDCEDDQDMSHLTSGL